MSNGPEPRTDNSPNLEHLNYLLTGIFNSASVGLAVFDPQLRIVTANPAFASMIAKSSVPNCAGKTINEILGCAAEDLEFAIKATFDTGRQHPSVDLVTKMPEADLVNHWLFNLLPIKDHVDGRLQVAAIAVETSHQKRIEQYFLTLMADMSWIKDQIFKDPPARQNPHDYLRPNEKIDLLGAVSEDVRHFASMLQGDASSSKRELELSGHSVAADQSVASRLEVQKLATLSPREREVLCLVASSKGSKEIAALLNIEAKTVDTYRARLMLKLDLHSISDLVLCAVRNHLVTP